MERTSCSFETKSVAEDGCFSGMASTWTRDLGGDRITRGAFAESLKTKSAFPLLFGHDKAAPVGWGTCEETEKGLALKGQLLTKDPIAQKVREFLQLGLKLAGAGCVGLSIGYRVPPGGEKRLGDERIISRCELVEISIVLWPMNTEATVTAVKGISDADWVDVRAAMGKLQRLRTLQGAGQGLGNEEVIGIYTALHSVLYRLDSYAPVPGLGTGNDSVTPTIGLGANKAYILDLASKISDCIDRIDIQ